MCKFCQHLLCYVTHTSKLIVNAYIHGLGGGVMKAIVIVYILIGYKLCAQYTHSVHCSE